MLRIGQSKSSRAAKRYFSEGFAQSDYFMGHDDVVGHQVGTWGGRAATMLGLVGDVQADAFEALCDNRRPDGSGSVTPRTKADRRVGFGCTFDAPKSYSIVVAENKDPALLRAFPTALYDTMSLMEVEARTRVRVGGRNELRVTGNLVWATFIHGTTRPVDGIPDPHVHGHVFPFNMTFDAIEGRFKAADVSFIKKNAPYYESFFNARLGELVRRAGYEIRQVGRSWEMAAVPAEAIWKFSRRTREIDEVATERGITDARVKAELGAQTRRRKSETLPASVVRAEWASRFTDEERKAIREAKSQRPFEQCEIDLVEVIDQALQNCLKYRSLTTDKQLVDEMLRLDIGRVQANEAHAAVEQAGIATTKVDGTTYRTTPESQQNVQRILSVARDGRGQVPAVDSPNGVRPESLSARGPLTRELLASQDRITILRSRGHCFRQKVEQELVGELLARGNKVMFITGERLSGDGSPATGSSTAGRTVRDFLDDPQASQKAEGRILWVRSPESVPVRDMAELFDTAVRSQARVVLAASRWRSAKPPAGDILAALERLAGLRSARWESNRKSREQGREAFEDFKSGRGVDPGTWGRDGSVHMHNDADVLKAAGREFVAAVRDKKSPLIITSGDPLEMSRTIRDAMEDAGLFKRGGRRVDQLVRLPFNDEQRRDAQVYRRGQVVQFYKATKGFRPGLQYTVLGHDPFGNVLARNGRFVEALPLSKSDRFGLFRKSTLMLRRGEFIRITSGGRTKNERFGLEKLLTKRQQAVRLANHKLFGVTSPDRRYRVPRDSHHRITGFTRRGDIKLDNGWVLPANFGHLDYGYCVVSEQRAIGSFGRVLVVDVPSAGGRLPSLSGLVCERVPELHIISADPAGIRSEFTEKEPEQEYADMGRERSFQREYRRSSHHEREAEYVREEYEYER
ncbi:MAG: relaxase domain-containing protein [Planctomycetes bacterium]|nr:relaxase domain-containing protein [Planctomycetota bacterium]